MAKKDSNVITISKKDIYIKRIKVLPVCIISGDPRAIQFLIEDKADSDKLKYRLYNHFLNHPKLVHYINTYLNQLFDFDKFSLEDLLTTFHAIVQSYGIDSHKKLFYTKFKVNQRPDFYKMMREYYLINDMIPSNSELSSLYTLYTVGIITDTNVQAIKSILDGGTDKKFGSKAGQVEQLTQIQGPTSKSDEARTFKDLSPKVQDFINSAKGYIRGRAICKNCHLDERNCVLLDTNLLEPGPVDIVLIGLNPGKDEEPAGVPFVGKAGKLLRRLFGPFVDKYNLTYMITNCILCPTANETDIKNVMGTIKNCKDLVSEIINRFPSKIKVVLGDKAMKSMNISGTITKNNGKMVDDHFVIIHPSSVLHNPNKLPDFKKAFDNLEQLISSKDMAHPVIVSAESVQQSIPSDKIIRRFEQGMSLFDIRVIGEQAVYILKTETGEKRYMIEQIQVPIYMKGGSYQDCKLRETNMDAVAYVSIEQRELLLRKLYSNVKKIVG